MPDLQWDRICETCVRRSSSIVLVAGVGGFLRGDLGLRQLQLPPVSPEGLHTALDEIMAPPHEVEQVHGCRAFLVRYGDEHRIRVDILGLPLPAVVIVTSLPPGAPPSLREGGGWYKGWTADRDAMTWTELFASCGAASGPDVLLAPGCPPMSRSKLGLRVFCAAPLSATQVAAMVSEIMPSPDRVVHEQGYVGFDIRFSPTNDVFRAAVFGDSSPQLVLLMGRPDNRPSPQAMA